MPKAWAVFLVGLVRLLLSPAGPAAGAWRLTCTDGQAEVVLKAPHQPPQPIAWARCDTTVDGTCGFRIERAGCGCAPVGCCGFNDFAVAVGKRLIVPASIRPPLRLRCRRAE